MHTLLIIEDQPQLLRNYATILEMEGYRVLTALQPREGIKIAETEKPELILCDLMMPELSGFDLLKIIRSTPGLETVPFVFLTARTARNDQREGMRLGADDYLTKPVSRDELLSVVETRIQRRLQFMQSGSSQGSGGFHPDFSSPDPLASKLNLTKREAEVLLWVAQGKSNADVGIILGMAEKTVKKHMSHIFEKLGVEGRNAATLQALEVLSGGDPNRT